MDGSADVGELAKLTASHEQILEAYVHDNSEFCEQTLNKLFSTPPESVELIREEGFLYSGDRFDVVLERNWCVDCDTVLANEQVIDGKSNKEIAEEVFLSPWTVKTHIKNIYKKMHVNSRAAAVRLALKRDIL